MHAKHEVRAHLPSHLKLRPNLDWLAADVLLLMRSHKLGLHINRTTVYLMEIHLTNGFPFVSL